MNGPKKKEIGFAVLIIAVGIAWLLNVYNVLPGVDWIWSGGLAMLGLLVLAIGGLNQLTVIVGPFLIVASALSVLRQTGRLSTNVEVPMLVIVFGVLLLCSHILPLAPPKYLQGDNDDEQNKTA
jgi:hypothetical protein